MALRSIIALANPDLLVSADRRFAVSAYQIVSNQIFCYGHMH